MQVHAYLGHTAWAGGRAGVGMGSDQRVGVGVGWSQCAQTQRLILLPDQTAKFNSTQLKKLGLGFGVMGGHSFRIRRTHGYETLLHPAFIY